MLNFRELTIEDKEWIDRLLSVDQFYGSEYCFSNIYNWRKAYHMEIARMDGFAVTRSGFKEFSYSYFGLGDRKALIAALEADAAASNVDFQLQGVLELEKQRLEQEFPGKFVFREDRDYFDYCYSVEKLASLKGRKLSKKRNHISQFYRDYPNWVYEPITHENIGECRAMAAEWYVKKGCLPGTPLDKERESLRNAFDHYWEEELLGGLIRVDGRIAAFTIGCRVNPQTVIVHYEKAFLEYNGAYAVVNQEFARHVPEGVIRMNREDDTGEDVLRKAKLSYQPDELLTKYYVTLREQTPGEE